MTAVLAVVTFVAICLVIKHAPYRWLNDRPATPAGPRSHPDPSPRGGTATPHTKENP